MKRTRILTNFDNDSYMLKTVLLWAIFSGFSIKNQFHAPIFPDSPPPIPPPLPRLPPPPLPAPSTPDSAPLIPVPPPPLNGMFYALS